MKKENNKKELILVLNENIELVITAYHKQDHHLEKSVFQNF